jgi:DNA-binding MarR family transcriptional regulator
LKIEEEIQQLKFQSEYQRLAVNIIYTANRIAHHDGRIFKEYNLTLQQFNVLRILRGKYPEPATVNYICKRMLDKSSNASRIVDKLLKKGWVERKICPDDRRSVDALIKQEGLNLLDQLEPELTKSENRLKTLSINEAKSANVLLDRLRG